MEQRKFRRVFEVLTQAVAQWARMFAEQAEDLELNPSRDRPKS